MEFQERTKQEIANKIKDWMKELSRDGVDKLEIEVCSSISLEGRYKLKIRKKKI